MNLPARLKARCRKQILNTPLYTLKPGVIPDNPLRDHQLYFLRCPLSGLVRYIGISMNAEQRYLTHASHSGTCKPWFKELALMGLKPVLQIVVSPIHRTTAVNLEHRLILLHSLMYPEVLLNRVTRTGRYSEWLESCLR